MLTSPGALRGGGPHVPSSTCLVLPLSLGLKRNPGCSPWRFALDFAEVQNLGLLDPSRDGGANETPEHDLGGPAIDASKAGVM